MPGCHSGTSKALEQGRAGQGRAGLGRPRAREQTGSPGRSRRHTDHKSYLSKEDVVCLPAAQLEHHAGGGHHGEDGQALAQLCGTARWAGGKMARWQEGWWWSAWSLSGSVEQQGSPLSCRLAGLFSTGDQPSPRKRSIATHLTGCGRHGAPPPRWLVGAAAAAGVAASGGRAAERRGAASSRAGRAGLGPCAGRD